MQRCGFYFKLNKTSGCFKDQKTYPCNFNWQVLGLATTSLPVSGMEEKESEGQKEENSGIEITTDKYVK